MTFPAQVDHRDIRAALAVAHAVQILSNDGSDANSIAYELASNSINALERLVRSPSEEATLTAEQYTEQIHSVPAYREVSQALHLAELRN